MSMTIDVKSSGRKPRSRRGRDLSHPRGVHDPSCGAAVARAPRLLEATDAPPSRAVDRVGPGAAYEVGEVRDRTTGVGQQAGVVVLHQLVDGLGRAGLVGPDVATRPALDPAGDIDARHLDAAERVGHRAGELV